jgi:hypothetical protein
MQGKAAAKRGTADGRAGSALACFGGTGAVMDDDDDMPGAMQVR